MGDLTKNISRSEMACKCGCGFDTCDFELITVIQDACNYWAEIMKLDKVILRINSGCRCPEHNNNEGGAEASLHTKGKAADIHIEGVSDWNLYNYLDKKYAGKYEIGLYIGRVHLGIFAGCHRYTSNK